MLIVAMMEQPVTPPAPNTSLDVLRIRIRRLHREAGEPSTRDLERRIGVGVVSHTTVHGVLRCRQTPKWGPLELVIEALGGDANEFRRLWVAVRDAENPPGNSMTESAPAGFRRLSDRGTDESADPILSFNEHTIRFADSFELFCSWLIERQPSTTIKSIREDDSHDPDFSCSGRYGNLSYHLSVELFTQGLIHQRRVDVIQEWLHPELLKRIDTGNGVVWDTSLFPIRKASGKDQRILHPLADCRDCEYWILIRVD